MRRGLIVSLAIAVLGVAAPASAGASRPPPGEISGVVLNTTCPGPCRIPPPPPPRYTGPGLVVRIRNVESGRIVKVLHPSDGRFAARVGPGLFRVHAGIAGDGCWRGSSRRVGLVDSGARLHLTVRNACIV